MVSNTAVSTSNLAINAHVNPHLLEFRTSSAASATTMTTTTTTTTLTILKKDVINNMVSRGNKGVVGETW
jgi:hypothetical protein